MTAHLVLDIETIPDPELPRQDEGDRVPPPPFNQIVTLGCLLLEDYAPKRLGVVGEHKSEGEMLTDFATWLDARKPTVVTWNGRSFDMPVITSRALKHGVPMPWWFSDRNTRYRYSTDGHFDVMDFLADFGATKNARLDAYAKLVGFPGKIGVDGSQVLPLVHAGKIDEVNSYCLCDVAQTAAIFLRVELLRGAFDRARYRALAETLLGFIDGQPRLAPLSAHIDRARFLLTPPVVATPPEAPPPVMPPVVATPPEAPPPVMPPVVATPPEAPPPVMPPPDAAPTLVTTPPVAPAPEATTQEAHTAAERP